MSNTKKKIAKINASEVFIKEDSLPEYLLKLNLDKLINMPGTVKMFAGNDIPDGWLLCDGSAISRETYVDLFNAIGTTWGEGDGSTTFNLPNSIGRFAEGAATSGSYKSAGLPNIEGSITSPANNASAQFLSEVSVSTSGALYCKNIHTAYAITDYPNNTSKTPYSIDFDASKSNSIYGSSTTVQPPSFTTKYIIKY